VPKTLSSTFAATSLSAALILSGCATSANLNKNYDKKTVMTGLFSTAKEAREKAKVLEIGKTPCPDGLKDVGFNPDAPNVEKLPGAKGLKHFLGTDNPQVSLSGQEDIDRIYEKFKRFFTLIYPIKNPQTDKDALYFNKQKSRVTGPDGEYFIICRENVVDYHDFNGKENKNEASEYKQVGGNVLEYFLRMIGNPLSLFGL